MDSKILVFLIILLITFSSCSSQSGSNSIASFLSEAEKNFIDDFNATDTQIQLAERIVNGVKKANLQPIDINQISSYDDYVGAIDNLNLAIEIINEEILDSEIEFLKKDTESFHKFKIKVEKYTPLIDNYNRLIYSTYSFDKDNKESAFNVLTTTGSLGLELALVLSFEVHMITFKTVGAFATTTGLVKFSSICGPCVSAIMSATYWKIKGAIVQLPSRVENLFSKED